MAKTPEEVLNTAYTDGTALAQQHGFKLVFEVSKGQQSNRYFIYRELQYRENPPFQGLILTDDDFGNGYDNLRFSSDNGRLETREEDGMLSIEKVIKLATEHNQVGIMLGEFYDFRSHESAPVLRLGISSLVPANIKDLPFLGYLSILLNRDYKVLDRFVEIKSYPEHLIIDSSVAEIIPGVRSFDNSWLLEDGSREVVKAILEDPFFLLERHNRLISLGRSEKVIS